MIEVLLAGILWGGFVGTMTQKTHSYCECYRDDFKGAYCESIKKTAEQGSCEGKKK